MTFRIIKISICFFVFVQSIMIAQIDSLKYPNSYSLKDTVRGLEYFKIGKSYLDRAKYDSSITAFREVEKIYSDLLIDNDDNQFWLKLVQAKNYIGYNLSYLSRYDESIKYLDEALILCKDKLGENNRTAAQIFQSLGIFYDYTDDLDKGLEMLLKALEIRLNILGAEHSDVSDTYNSIGIIYSKRSNKDKALEYFTKSLQIKKKIYGEEHSHTATAYSNIGINYYERGDYGKAFEYYNYSLNIRLKTMGEQHHLTASSYNNLGNCLNEMDEFDKAEENHLKALDIRKKVLGHDHDLVATSYTNLGLTSWRKGNYNKALDYINLALDIHTKKLKRNHSAIAMDYMNIGVMYKAKNQLDSALIFYNKAIDIFNNSGNLKSVNASKIYQNISEAYFAKGQYDSSLIAIQKSIQSIVFDFDDDNINANPNLNLVLSEVQLLNALKIKSKVFAALANNRNLSDKEKIHLFTKSILIIDLADSLIDRMIRGFKNEESKFVLGDKAKSIFEQGIDASYRLFKITNNKQYLEKLLYFIEKSKAAVLQQGILDSKAKQYSNIPNDILQKEKLLKDDLIFYEARLKTELTKANSDDSLSAYKYQSKLLELKNEYENLVKQIEKNYPAYFSLKYQNKIYSSDKIRNELDKNTMLINYFIGDSLIYIASIDKDNLNIVVVNKPDKFDELIKNFYSSIQKAETKSFIEFNNRLSDIFISPVRDLIVSAKKLIIIPDGIVYKIPFEVLFTDQQEITARDYSKLHFLINDFDVSYHYSASLYVSSMEQKKRTSLKNFIGFAPVFPKEKSLGYTITSKPNSLLASNEEVMRSVSVDGKTFDELKYSEWEVNSIIDLFSKNNSSGINTAYFYADAKEDSFKTNVSDYKIVHIASHSFMNEDQPDISGVIFAQPTDSVFTNDGILYSAETYNLDLSADLVVLSSCESGLGKLFKGEGMIALTRGFLYSGVSNIIFSLWKIPDKHTSELMVEFYKQMISGKSYAESLRQAKLKLISNSLTARPRSWAGFLLIGVD